MAHHFCERLSAQDNGFLHWESPNIHMHVSLTHTFEAGPLRNAVGGIDVGAIRQAIGSRLYRVPRYRQRLAWIPFENHAVWVDDDHFNLDYHIRHTSLPKPGSEEQLKQLSARIMAQQLDRSRPLWETWVVEGLEGDRFAFVTKIHHCMIDGVAGVDLGQILMSTSPRFEIEETPAFIPRPRPTPVELWREAQVRRLSLPRRLLQSLRELHQETEDLPGEILARIRALRELADWSTTPPSKTPINREVGPHRAFDWLTIPLADVKAVRKGLGCTVNDVVLTTVTGAMREFMLQRQVRPESLDFRVQSPVNTRDKQHQNKLGNHVSGWILRLPLDESDPRKQLGEIHRVTKELKKSKQALGIQTMNTLAEWTSSSVLTVAVHAASRAINMIVTNVAGPQMPLYMLGAKQLMMFPQAPLLPGVGLAIAIVSYNGLVCWGLNADYEMVPDLRRLAELIQSSFEQVAEAAGVNLGAGPVVDLESSSDHVEPARGSASNSP